MGKIRVFTAFSGYDSQCLALNLLKEKFSGFDYDLVGWSEIDKFAIKAHDVLFPQYSRRSYGDISKIDWSRVPDFDLFTYSSPCQDFSSAGLQRGGQEGSGTRSSLLWECRRAIIAKRPRFLLLENVSALVSQKFLPLFNKWQEELESYGYTNYAQILNAKDYGIPQNRERIFLISILNGEMFFFPKKIKLERNLKNMLEDEVDEKYYLSDKTIKSFTEHCQRKQLDGCINTNAGGRQTDNFIIEKRVAQIGNIVDDTGIGFKNPQRGRIYSFNGLSPCLNCCSGGGLVPKIYSNYRIRKLTPKECFRLMGVEDKDVDKIKNVGISDSQQYKLAGNSIVVDVLFHIFRKMFIDKENESKDMYLF